MLLGMCTSVPPPPFRGKLSDALDTILLNIVTDTKN